MTDLAEIDRLLASAWAALCGARAVANRSPNAETLRIEDITEERVNWLLEKRLQLMREGVRA